MKRNLEYSLVTACAMCDRYVIFKRPKDRWLAREEISNTELHIRNIEEQLNTQLAALKHYKQRLNRAKINLIKGDCYS